MRNRFFLILFFLCTFTIVWSQGTESFTNVPSTGTSYTSISWTGDNGLSWSGTGARTDQTLNGKAVTIRDNGGNVVCNTIPGGCGTLTFDYVRAFTSGSPSLSVYINAVQVGATYSSTNSTTQTATITVNVTGTFNLEIRQTVAGTSNRMIIDNIAWTAAGPSCTEPASSASSIGFSSITSTSSTINWTPGTGTNSLVVIRAMNAIAGSPVSGTAYTANSIFGNGQSISAGEFVIYNGVGSSVSVSGLNSGTTYYVAVYTFNNSDNCYRLSGVATANFTTSCSQPTVQVTTISPSASNTSALVSWSGGNGNSTLVKINTSNSFTPPSDLTVYSASTSYTSGEQVVYNGTGSSVTVTGLSSNTTYYLTAYTFNSCSGSPDYFTTGTTSQSFTTTTVVTGEPAGYYASATGLTCAPLKTALSSIITTGMTPKTYGDLWTQYLISDIKPREVGPGSSANVIWDIYSDNPSGTDPYNFTPGPVASGGQQDNGSAASSEGILYNREHSVPQSWFGASASSGSVGPESDYFHIFPTDKIVNANRGNYIYGLVSSPTITSANGSKLGPNTVAGMSGTAFEPINDYKGDLARAFFYFVTRYQTNMPAWQTLSTEGDKAFDGTTWPSIENNYLQMLLNWHNLDPVSQKEIDRNNAGYIFQGNRNPFIDHPEYVAAIWSGSCGIVLPVELVSFTAKLNNNTVQLNWEISTTEGLDFFIVERSIDGGRTFQQFATVPGADNVKKYTAFDDVTRYSGNVYYRLKTVDLTNVFKYSNVIAEKLPDFNGLYSIYPNPANQFINISFSKPTIGTTIITMLDFSGRPVKSNMLLSGATTYNLKIEDMARGTYILKIQTGNQLAYSQFIKQ